MVGGTDGFRERGKKGMTGSFTIGIMQGRLLPPVNGKFQAFPAKKWEEEFRLGREVGIDCIEFIFEGENYEEHPLMNVKGLETIKRLESETGVKVLSVCADYFMDFPMHKGSRSQIENSIEVLKELIKNCAKLDVKDVVIPCVDRSGLSGKAETGLFEASIKKCLDLAGECNINLSLETDLSPAGFLYLLNRFDSPNIKVNYDIGNSSALGYDPLEEFEAYGKWISDVHIKDRLYKGTTVPLGSGDANFDVVLEWIRETDFKGPFILQAARKENGKEKETIREYMKFVKRYFKADKV